MKFYLNSNAAKADILVLLLEKGEKLSAATRKTLGSLAEEAKKRIKAKDFEGEEGETIILYGKKNIVLLGMGDLKSSLPQAMEQLGGKIASIAKKMKSESVAIMVKEDYLSDIANGIVLGAYEFDKYKKKDAKKIQLKEVIFLATKNKKNKEIMEEAEIFSLTSPLTRDLVNIPAGDLSTKDMVNEARKLAKKYGMKIIVMNEAQLKKAGCGAILGVGQGAKETSKLIFLQYKKASKSKVPNLAFIGKGVVFDTGGLNLKPTGYIETMKQDMAGAATVLGTMKAIAEAKLKGHYLGVLACAENAVSDRAQRPGDVVRAFNGKSIEISNTDAEGRLCLADALSYTEAKFKPKKIVDIATLTGAVSVALGYFITGVMGNNEKFLDQVLKAASAAGERAWPLPLDADFIKATKGDFTDLKNSTNGVRAGSSMGGAFLSNFVTKDTPWVHFDIGGTAWAEKTSSTTKYGATGVALRTLFKLADQHQG